MNIIRQHKTTSIFVFLLIIAGILNLLTKTSSSLVNTLMFCANFMIYIGLIVLWAYTVKDRILPTKTRTYMLASSGFMIVYLLQRVFRYRVVITSMFVYRSMAYIYYIPLVMIPSLLFATAVNLGLGNKRSGRTVEKIIIATACVVSALALTNDLHHLVYVPKVALSEFNMGNNTYSWGIGFYIIYAWMIIALVSGALILFSIVGKNGKKPIFLLAVTVVTWIVLCTIHAFVFERFSIVRPYFKPEIDCFSMILIFEFCIRSRLIPHNENYKGFFEKLRLPILITDKELNAVNTSNKSLNVTAEDLEKAKTEPFYPDKDIRLSSMKIRAGYAFWTENEHELHEQRNRLKEANELLSEENDLIAVENKLKEQKRISKLRIRYMRGLLPLSILSRRKLKRSLIMLNLKQSLLRQHSAKYAFLMLIPSGRAISFCSLKTICCQITGNYILLWQRRAVSSNAAGSMRQQSVKSIPRFLWRRLTSFTILSRPLQRHIWNRQQE